MLRVTDRHDRDMLYGPTNEEVIVDIFRNNIKSYKALPKNFYHMQWKFRDEIRPRFGLMRGREFLMKDAYSFDVSKEEAEKTYDAMFEAYLKIFKRLGLQAVPVKAETGAIGGDLSHEFHVLADTGESDVYYDKKLDEGELTVAELKDIYAMADDMHDASAHPDTAHKKGIEVGHIFYLGTKYSEALSAKIQDEQGKEIAPHMGCYGIGVSRLIGAIIEANHDDSGIIWPQSVAPFDTLVLNLKPGHKKCDAMANELYAKLPGDVLLDDTNEGAGAKFARAELIGIPKIITIGPKLADVNKVELKLRANNEKQEIDFSEVF